MANIKIGNVEVPVSDVLAYLESAALTVSFSSSDVLKLAEIVTAYIAANPTDTSQELTSIKTTLTNAGLTFTS